MKLGEVLSKSFRKWLPAIQIYRSTVKLQTISEFKTDTQYGSVTSGGLMFFDLNL